jgi:hypothetical protein
MNKLLMIAGVISGALLQLQHEFALSCFQSEVVVSMLLVGCLCASLVTGTLCTIQLLIFFINVFQVLFLIGLGAGRQSL